MVPIIAFPSPSIELKQDPVEFPASKVFCPICVANGYASSAPAADRPWFATYNSVGGALWNSSIPRWQLGLGFHGSSGAVRVLASYRAIQPSRGGIGLNLGYGFQSVETGAAGFSATLEGSPSVGAGSLNLFAGASLQSDDSRLRPLAGFKWSPDGRWFAGAQHDGRALNPFVQRSFRSYSVGALLVSSRALTLTVGYHF